MQTGSEIAGYRVERVLATGGMGTVYLAHNPALSRLEALKVLNPDLSGDPGFRERFLREADIAASLDHPNIVSVYDRGESEDGRLWIAMQYVVGTDAEAALKAGTVTPARAVHIVGEIAEALDYAHSRGIVHHDVKPSNFLLSADADHVLLTDFGVARTLEHSVAADDPTVTATLAYAAPEVITGGDVGIRADVYSLGCTLFRLVTGKQPFFDADGTTALIQAHLHQSPPRISDHLSGRSPGLDRVVITALAKNPADRFGSARELAAEAATALGTAMPQSDSPPRNDDGTAPRGIAHTSAPRVSQPPPPEAWASFWSNAPDRPVPITISTPPPARRKSKRALSIGAAIMTVVALVVTGIALFADGSDPAAPTTSSPSSNGTRPPATDDAHARLQALLPVGYPSGSCSPAPTPSGGAAAVACGANADPGGPVTGSYELMKNATALQDRFDEVARDLAIVVCPGNIQSPGPWTRKDSPTVPRGTVFCGIRDGRPVVAWTTVGEMLLSSVEGAVGTPLAMADVFAWWASHS